MHSRIEWGRCSGAWARAGCWRPGSRRKGVVYPARAGGDGEPSRAKGKAAVAAPAPGRVHRRGVPEERTRRAGQAPHAPAAPHHHSRLLSERQGRPGQPSPTSRPLSIVRIGADEKRACPSWLKLQRFRMRRSASCVASASAKPAAGRATRVESFQTEQRQLYRPDPSLLIQTSLASEAPCEGWSGFVSKAVS